MEVQGGTSEMSGLSLKDNGEKKKNRNFFKEPNIPKIFDFSFTGQLGP